MRRKIMFVPHRQKQSGVMRSFGRIDRNMSTQNSGKNSGRRGRIENLKPWRKGQSGNPGGRPKRDLPAEIAAAIFEENHAEIYRAMFKALLKGNPKVFAVLADRAYGRVTHSSAQSENASAEPGRIVVEFVDVAKLEEP